MGKQRQSWSVEEKLATVLSERQSVAEVARQRGVNENQAHHLSISHHFTKGRQREIILQTSLQVTQPPRKPRHGAAVEFSEAPMVGIGLGVGFFSSGVGQCNVSSRPTCAYQYIANDLIKIRRSR